MRVWCTWLRIKTYVSDCLPNLVTPHGITFPWWHLGRRKPEQGVEISCSCCALGGPRPGDNMFYL
eukprot:2548212-Alexandrium_andersonii.AAC.1